MEAGDHGMTFNAVVTILLGLLAITVLFVVILVSNIRRGRAQNDINSGHDVIVLNQRDDIENIKIRLANIESILGVKT